ncbi:MULTISPECIES: DUF2059 domain-containing protein [unclassified Novosphingobium]|uniref:DUF2059 domain-containing protein n=1 Tax=unclassified Novosphingobium TaxID=2644732 RepID=UPI0025F0BC8E|nr:MULTISPECIES: DUF2059 domain-containing protein [unclassified Novosphingobium]HQV04459.1 DUF2059 domain-containing protein [Novosphingobium sp.]
MTRRFKALAAFSVLALAQPGLLAAQTDAAAKPAETATVAVDQAHLRLYDVILGGVDIQAMAQAGADSIFDGLVRNEPRMAQLAERNPGMRAEFRTMAMPFLKTWMTRSTSIMRERVAARFARHYTAAEAAELGQFYDSPVGRKLMKAFSGSMTFDKTVDQALQSGSSSQPMVNADVDKSLNAGLARFLPTLSPAEKEEFIRMSKRPVFAKLGLISQAMQGIEQPKIDEMSTPEEREAFGQALRTLFEKAMAN